MTHGKFLLAANALAKSSNPTQLQILAVTQELAQLITDVTGKSCELVIRFPEIERPCALPGQIDMGEVWEAGQ